MIHSIAAPAASALTEDTPSRVVPALTIRDLHVAYREGSRVFPALHGLDLAIRPGEFVALTGQNGSGKTTFCRVLAGFVPEHIDADVSGIVQFDGRPMLQVSTRERVGLVGYVFDAPYDQLTGAARTVEEEVAFGLENMGVPRAEMQVRIADALRLVRIDHLAGRHPLSLSGGQTQRLALASVLALRPSVLVLDEPTSQLDPLGTTEVVEAVSRLSRAGLTVVYVTHDLEPILDVADRLVVMAHGKAVADGPVREVIGALVDARMHVETPPSVAVGVALQGELQLHQTPLLVDECVAAVRDAAVQLRAVALDAAPTDAPAPVTGTLPIRLEGVSFRYPNGTEALRGVDLHLDGGCICFIGQNGSGKSTLMRHLNGLLRPTAGHVLVGDLDTAASPVHELARHVGVAFQNPDDQLFSRTVSDEVGFGARSMGFSDTEVAERVADALELLDLAAVAEKRPLELGLAARKRVIAASVIAMGCSVVVLDEPTSAQDAPGVAAIERAVRRLRESGRTAIVVSHDMEFVARAADRVVAMLDGAVLLDGSPAEVFGEADSLARTSVHPPAVVRMGLALGITPPPLTPIALIGRLELAPR